MDPATHETLIRATTRLRGLIGSCSTRSVLGVVLSYHLRRANDLSYTGGLSSPARQIAFRLGLLLTTPEPAKPRDFAGSPWDQAVDLLEDIFRAYQAAMWPSEDELKHIDGRWRQVRAVAGQALLHFHNTGLLASVDQIAKRVRDYITPFDSVVARAWELRSADALGICDWIRQSAQRHGESLESSVEAERTERLSLLGEWEQRGLSLDQFRQVASAGPYQEIFRTLLSRIDDLGVVRRSDVVATFGATGEAFWRIFTIPRGGVELTYLTETNPVDTHPLILLDSEAAVCPSLNALYEAVLTAGEGVLEASEARDAYHRARDSTLERQARDALTEILGPGAKPFSSVFETPDGHFEHDLVVLWEGYLLVVEAKASPPREPFRDLEKGFVRLQRAFRSDGGIQKAFDQADRIRRRLAEGERVSLFDSHGSLLIAVDPSSIENVFTICVTRDDYGPLASDLSLLLERPNTHTPYPWAVSILSLQTMAMGWGYLCLGPREFVDFLNTRRQLHGRALAWDELDIVGFFLKHGGLHWLTDPKADFIHINPNYADVFDQIYAAIHLGGPPVTVEITEPFMGNVREMLGEMVGQLAAAKRNDPCPCGSGKKFKKCHGKTR